MKLTKQLEAEIKKFMITYWDTYFKGDLKTWASFLPADYKNIGGTEEEIWNSKKEILDYSKGIINQMVGQAEIRNKKTQIFSYEPYIMVHEFLDMFIKVNSAFTFYGKFRLSSIIQKTSGKWKVLHQHGSYPDSKTADGEAFAFDTLKSENIKLLAAVKSRTAELEQKNRDLELEVALERVRARTMAMHKTSELQSVIHTVHQELLKLNLGIHGGSFIAINSEIDKELHCWGSGGTADTSEEVRIPYYNKPFYTNIVKRIKKATSFFTEEYSQKEKKDFFTFLFKHEPWSKLKAKEKKETLSSPGGYTRSCCVSKHTSIFIINHFGEKFSDDENEILNRFGKVFEQTYTRFLDLKKAEEQTREAQINLAVERVRARALAMYKSDEILELVFKLKQEIMDLDIPNVAAATIHLKEANGNYTMWDLTSMEGKFHQPMVVNYRLDELDPNLFIRRMWENTAPYFLVVQDEEDFKRTFQFLRNHDRKKEADESEAFLKSTQINKGYHPTIPLNNGRMCIDLLEPPSDEIETILTKMGAAFDLAYKRFEDLQKAEAQAREAQIETALEKVRSRSLAMHKSDELNDVVAVVFEKLKELQIPATAVGIGIPIEGSKDFNAFVCGENEAGLVITNYRLPFFENIIVKEFYNAFKKQLDFFVGNYSKKEKNAFYKYLFEHSAIKDVPDDIKNMIFESPTYTISMVAVKNALFNVNDFEGKILSENEVDIIKRFAKVFNQTYTRFLDLQKAEAQAREAQIEAALERVRSRSMAMHKSEELADLSLELVKQVQALGVATWFCAFNINDEDGKGSMEWGSNGLGTFPKYRTPREGIFLRYYKAGQKGETLLVNEIGEDDCPAHYEYLCSLPGVGEQLLGMKAAGIPFPASQIDHVAFFKYGYVLFITYEPVPTSHEIFKRFAKVFEQTYTRFLDLQKAEAQARESQIETGLEKVRSRTLAMQKSDELADTTMVIFEQLINLGIAPNRLFIGIIRNETGNIDAWATNEDGTRIGKSFTLNIERNESVKKMYLGWKHKKTSIEIDMQGEELQNYFHYLAEEMKIPFKGGLSHKRRVQTIAYFGQGLIGMASPEEQPPATTQLLERFAAVFNLTYTRFNDLKIAEAHAIQAEEDLIKLQTEKRRAEEALSNLQVTQKQLVQAEKMASLGELTAGIAHEIQNPLNFVNNFSEVSRELLDEVKEEIEKGNLEDAKEIMNDVIQNLEKINHHGQRADAIVKGMLQHSRSSSGTKQPTAINTLADEYLRLAYHGLRAKDKSFNASMKTDFDKSINEILVIPQDMGRVILNLITNAFYAVADKKKNFGEGYEPTVSVSTKKINDTIEIKVADNGNGIPQNIADKIFQPFFTTKPTGQGTGLGLSLSYDIVKAHGGEIKVESAMGEATSFTIQLPIISI